MAGGRIAGITLEINGDTTGLQQALKGVDSSLKNTQSQLKDVNKLLKVDPGNVELLKQKQELVGKAVEDTKKKLETQKEALKQLEAQGSTDPKVIEQQAALKREIIATEQSLKDYESQLKLLPVELESISVASADVAEKTKGLSLAAAGLGTAMLGNAYNAAKTADDLNTLSKQTGFSVEELQKMQYASDLVDVSMDTMTGSITKLTKGMASGSKSFETLGVSITDENGNMRNATDVWYDSLQALGKIQNETERDALSMEIFGKSAMEMAGIVDDGGEALKAAGSEAEQLGLVLSADTLQAANEFNDSIDKLKARAGAAFLEAGASLAETLVPALEKAVEAITKVLQWFSDLDGSTQAFILTVAGLVAAISPVASIIAAVTGAAAALNVAMLPMIATVGGIILALGALVAAGVLLYKNWDKVKKVASDLLKNLKKTFNDIYTSIKTAMSNAWTSVKSVFSSIQSYITTTVNTVKTNVTNGFNAVKTTVTNVLNSIKSTVTSAWNAVSSTVTSVMNTVKNTVSTVWNSITSTVSTVVSGISTTVNTAFTTVKNNINTALTSAKTTVTNLFNGISSAISSAMNTAKTTVSGAVNAIKGFFNFSLSIPSVATGALDTAKTAVNNAVSAIKGFFNFSLKIPSIATSAVDTAKNAVNNAVNSIKGFFNFSWKLPSIGLGNATSIYDTVSSAVDKVKGLFNFSWSLPHIKTPHFSVSGGVPPYGWMGQGSLPHISVSWYKKAYDNAMLFRNPTVLPTASGFKGFGDGPGAELVIGMNKLREMVGSAGNTINVNVYAAQGMSEQAVANAVALKLDRWLGERI